MSKLYRQGIYYVKVVYIIDVYYCTDYASSFFHMLTID